MKTMDADRYVFEFRCFNFACSRVKRSSVAELLLSLEVPPAPPEGKNIILRVYCDTCVPEDKFGTKQEFDLLAHELVKKNTQ